MIGQLFHSAVTVYVVKTGAGSCLHFWLLVYVYLSI